MICVLQRFLRNRLYADQVLRKINDRVGNIENGNLLDDREPFLRRPLSPAAASSMTG